MQNVDAKGGCLCGAIRYNINGSVMAAAACHCRDCQYVTGGAPAYVFVVAKSAVAITKGIPEHYDNMAESGNRRRRYFCGKCGTPLYAEDSAFPDIVSVKVGSLDDPSIYKPAAQFWTSSAPAWHHFDNTIPKYEKGSNQAD
ncbi:MAG: GFA family protein [Hyphomicrobiaceae bacterium]